MCLLNLPTNAARAAGNDDFNCAAAHPPDNTPAVIATTLGDTPALVRIPARVSQAPIILWHGFGTPASERALMAALPLDEVPAVKVYLGLPMFGSRQLAGGMAELGRRQSEDLATLVFEPIVMGAAKELPAVVRALERHRCIERGGHIGLFGFSAGGAAVLYALAEADVPIDVAVTLNASAGLTASVNAYERATKGSYTWTDAARRLARRSDAVSRAKDIATGHPPPALLLIHGKDDTMLTTETAMTLHSALLPLYREANATQRLQLTVVPGLAHGWMDSGNVAALRSSIAAWFHTYLSAAGTLAG
jgi:dienelactone hydrolase